MFTDECSYTKCFYYICIVNDLLYEKRKIKEMKLKKKVFFLHVTPRYYYVELNCMNIQFHIHPAYVPGYRVLTCHCTRSLCQ